MSYLLSPVRRRATRTAAPAVRRDEGGYVLGYGHRRQEGQGARYGYLPDGRTIDVSGKRETWTMRQHRGLWNPRQAAYETTVWQEWGPDVAPVQPVRVVAEGQRGVLVPDEELSSFRVGPATVNREEVWRRLVDAAPLRPETSIDVVHGPGKSSASETVGLIVIAEMMPYGARREAIVQRLARRGIELAANSIRADTFLFHAGDLRGRRELLGVIGPAIEPVVEKEPGDWDGRGIAMYEFSHWAADGRPLWAQPENEVVEFVREDVYEKHERA